MRRRDLVFAVALLPPAVLPGPAFSQAAAPAAVPVVASFSVLADLVQRVGGDRVSVRALVGPDVDAHGFQPRPSDSAAIRAAAVVVRNGLGFEPWLDRLIRASGTRAGVVTAAEGVAAREAGEDGGHGHADHRHRDQDRGAPDPHAWQDLRNIPTYLRNIAAGLSAADPSGAAAFARNAEAATARVHALDAWVRERIATVPPARRRVVTSHDAFGYFGAAYGVEFLSPQGVSTASEPSAAQVARLIRQIRATGTTAVFLENMAAPATLERLAREAGVTVRGKLYADALSAADGPAPDFEAMVRHNVALMVRAMGGEAG